MRPLLKTFSFLFFLTFNCYSTGVCFQSGTNLSDTVITDTTQIDSTVQDTALEDSVADTLDAVNALKVSTEELKKGQQKLLSNFDSLQSAIIELSADESSNSNFWLYFTLVALSILGLMLIGISFYLYREQRIRVQDTIALVPQKWGQYLKSLGNELEKFGNSVGKRLGNVEQRTQNNTERIESMIETYMQLQDALDKKDTEIERLRDGYDSQIYREFLYRFIKVDQALTEASGENITQKDLQNVKKLMDDAFSECRVERFAPEVGEDYTSAKGVDENPERVSIQDPEKEYEIAEIKEEGYKLNSGEQAEILVPAKVKIYVIDN